MKTTREKAEMVRDQVISKIHWGAGEREVVTWLKSQHGISGPPADRLIREAFRARALAIRKRSLGLMVLFGLGLLVFGGWYFMQVSAGVIVVGVRSLGILVLAVLCLGAFLRNLWKFLSGRDRGGVDF